MAANPVLMPSHGLDEAGQATSNLLSTLQARGELLLLGCDWGSSICRSLQGSLAQRLPRFPRTESIPEIQDLNVRPRIPTARHRLAALLDEAEQLIGARSPLAGIGFGLYADYGAAQRLYVKRGYVPDGHGAYYRRAACGRRRDVFGLMMIWCCIW